MDNQLPLKIEKLTKLLQMKRLRVATAESCTGGGVAQALTSVAGSSDWFECGFVTYSNASKQSMLAVSSRTLAQSGGVSEAVVKEMAIGAVKASAAQLAVAVSGVAGPGGGTPSKPVGTVWVGWVFEQQINATCFQFSGDRAAVRDQSIDAAIDGLILLLSFH